LDVITSNDDKFIANVAKRVIDLEDVREVDFSSSDTAVVYYKSGCWPLTLTGQDRSQMAARLGFLQVAPGGGGVQVPVGGVAG
jgi:hypothetical protein